MVNIEYTGLYSVRFESKLNKWLAVGGDISALRMTGDLYKGFDNRHRKSMTGNAIYVMPEVRFFYFTSKLSTLSGALQGGAGIQALPKRHRKTRRLKFPQLFAPKIGAKKPFFCTFAIDFCKNGLYNTAKANFNLQRKSEK